MCAVLFRWFWLKIKSAKAAGWLHALLSRLPVPGEGLPSGKGWMPASLLLAIGGMIWMAALPNDAAAQTPSANAPLLRGQLTGYLEFYDLDADSLRPRRPDFTWRVNFQGEFNFSRLKVPVALLLSSENSSSRQQLNLLSISPTWGWGQLHLGNANMRLSDFTLNGESVLGGGVELHPGVFRFSAAVGRANRAVEGIPGGFPYGQPGTFSRSLYAARIGVGRQSRGVGFSQGSFIDLNMLYARDDTASIARALGTRAQENLVADLDGKLLLFEKKLRLSGEIAASAHTRDLHNSPVQLDSVESKYKSLVKLFDNFFDIRLSTRVGYAYRFAAEWSEPSFGLLAEALTVSPGFTSLGRPYFQNDRVEYSLAPRLALARNKLQLRAMLGLRRDNLAGEKLSTTRRLNVDFSFQARPGRAFSLLGKFSNYSRNTDTPAQTGPDTLTFRVNENQSRTYTLSPALNFPWLGAEHLLRFTVVYLRFDEQSAIFFQNTILNVGWTVVPMKGISLTPGFDYTRTSQPAGETKTTAPSLAGSLLTRNGKLGLSFSLRHSNGSVMFSEKSKQLAYRVEAGYSPSLRDRFSVELGRVALRSHAALPGADFTERRVGLRYSRRF